MTGTYAGDVGRRRGTARAGESLGETPLCVGGLGRLRERELITIRGIHHGYAQGLGDVRDRSRRRRDRSRWRRDRPRWIRNARVTEQGKTAIEPLAEPKGGEHRIKPDAVECPRPRPISQGGWVVATGDVCRHVSEDVPVRRKKWDVCRHVSEDVPA